MSGLCLKNFRGMKTIDKVIAAGLLFAVAGVVIFWVAGFNNRLDVASWSLCAGGIASYVAIGAMGLKAVRRWQRGF